MTLIRLPQRLSTSSSLPFPNVFLFLLVRFLVGLPLPVVCVKATGCGKWPLSSYLHPDFPPPHQSHLWSANSSTPPEAAVFKTSCPCRQSTDCLQTLSSLVLRLFPQIFLPWTQPCSFFIFSYNDFHRWNKHAWSQTTNLWSFSNLVSERNRWPLTFRQKQWRKWMSKMNFLPQVQRNFNILSAFWN